MEKVLSQGAYTTFMRPLLEFMSRCLSAEQGADVQSGL